MNLRSVKELYWELRRYPDQAVDILLQPVSPFYRQRRKYNSELDYWRRELMNFERWYGGNICHWGVPSPTHKLAVSEVWVTNAVLTWHSVNPNLLEELLLEPDAFLGKRVLEVGCGPSAPILQFAGCERHGIDPLIDRYIKVGWPLFDYDVTFVNAFAEDMPYPDGYFDAVISRNALDHVDDFPSVAREIGRVLKPGGGLFFSVEYHRPTLNEPQQLNDESIKSAFRHLNIGKIRERGMDELNRDLAKRFNLNLASLTERSGLGGDERFAVWHGSKPG
jgi:SAM-dependent methyltransferase